MQNKKAFKFDDQDPPLNSDLDQFVVVDTNKMDWSPTPEKGVWRKRLEVIPGEHTQLTTLVKFEPGCSFDQHGHPAGEEFMILSGVFSDDSGDFRKGSYARNPDGYHHAPWTTQGCELFVKLGQFQKDDNRRLHINTMQESGIEEAVGVRTIPLHTHGNERVALYRLDENASLDPMQFHKHVEIFILNGSLCINSETCTAGVWVRSTREKLGVVNSAGGCSFYLKMK